MQSILVDPSNTIPRQRSQNLRLPDEEQGLDDEKRSQSRSPLPKVISPGAESQTRRRFREISQELSQSLKIQENKQELLKFWDQWTRKGKRKIGVVESLKAIVFSSWLNIFLVFIPLAWVSHFFWGNTTTFVLCFFAIIPLERLFDWGGEQMAYYLGKDIGDLVVITLNNAVEATLAILLLKKCELVLLKSTIIGVVILHLLLVPGTAFVTGGVRIIQQDLHPHLTQLNHSLLTIGVLTLLIPASFFASMDSPVAIQTSIQKVISDDTRHMLLQMSRGLAVILLVVYVCSRIYLHNPPGDENDLASAPLAPDALKEHALRLQNEDPEVNQYVCIAMLAICIGLMAATAEWLVESIEFVRESHIKQEWFGLILLPIVSFAADGTVAVVYFIRYTFRHFFREPTPPTTLARAEAIDLSIQFVLFWMPLFVLIGWWTNKPMTLLFETFEVAVLVGSCFLVNYVTADSKTNWAEGAAMVCFYCMIALCSWFYDGQVDVQVLSSCGTVEETLANYLATGTLSE
ncbi:hypothetical protein CVT26_000872 [Gymnopilus dilepis]|uniref:Sodium/calcium exchanger membrane region domain-containing protein n=1 Tax=Gymnopilus dilepis TaxID=231916 RepID=A0A409YMR3_9AGAR|nr:hypothetical protein CVT26_000872 [Gymnopilus dilepis]